MGRWPGRIAALLSLLAAMGFATACIHSYWAYTVASLQLNNDRHQLRFVSLAYGRGGVRFEYYRFAHYEHGRLVAPPPSEQRRYGYGMIRPAYYPVLLNPQNPMFHGFSWHGFEMLWFDDPPSQTSSGYGVTFQWYLLTPIWPWILLCCVLPAAVAWRWRRVRRRVQAGHCQICGYDLRATPQRCPECGTVSALMPPGWGCRGRP